VSAQKGAEEMGMLLRQLQDSMASLANTPLIRGFNEAEAGGKGGAKHLFVTADGLRRLHAMMLADMNCVQDASWHALVRRLDNKSPDECHQWLAVSWITSVSHNKSPDECHQWLAVSDKCKSSDNCNL